MKLKKNKFNAIGLWVCPVCWHKLGRNRSAKCPIHSIDKSVYFHSTGEFDHWIYLLSLVKFEMIKDLIRQERFDIMVGGVKIGTYTADFSYVECKDGSRHVVDFKGYDTADSKLRRKAVKALYGVDVEIVRKTK